VDALHRLSKLGTPSFGSFSGREKIEYRPQLVGAARTGRIHRSVIPAVSAWRYDTATWRNPSALLGLEVGFWNSSRETPRPSPRRDTAGRRGGQWGWLNHTADGRSSISVA
jgi:hypothetical protein